MSAAVIVSAYKATNPDGYVEFIKLFPDMPIILLIALWSDA
jgi:hypothetical protein